MSEKRKDPLQDATPKAEIRHIAIEGVIGAGKTSLALMLAERLQAKLILEEFEDNPFLAKFYEDPDHYAFHTQIYFLLSRYRQLQELRQADLFHEYLIADYIFEKDRIFAYLNLADDELKLYETITASIEHNVPVPDLVVYIQSGVDRLIENIHKRGRDTDRRIGEQYLKDLNEAYNYFFFRYKAAPLLIVNATQIDFVGNEQHFEDLVREIFRKDRAPVEYYNPVK